MASKKTCSEIDYNYCSRIIDKMFPHYEYNPQLLTKPTKEFVLDIMGLFVNYFFNDFSNQMPKFEDALEDLDQMDESQQPSCTNPWELLAKCNEILRRCNSGAESGTECSELFSVGDIACPSKKTARKIMLVLGICVHLHDMDFSEQFHNIQEILNKRASIPDLEQLKKKKTDLQVASACAKHKLENLKSKEELECLHNALLVKSTKFEERKNQLKNEYDNLQTILLQRKTDHEAIVKSVKQLEDQLVDENHVEALKMELQSLKLKKMNLITDGENLQTKSKNTTLTKQLLEFQLNKLTDSEQTLKQYENYRKVENDLTVKVANNFRVNADLIKQIENYEKEIELLNNGMELSNLENKFKINESKVQSDIVTENKKLQEIKSDAVKAKAKVEVLLTNIETKSDKCEQLQTNIKKLNEEVTTTMDAMLQEALKELENDDL